MNKFMTNGERRRWLANEARKLPGHTKDDFDHETLWDKFSIFIMLTDGEPKTFQEWLDS